MTSKFAVAAIVAVSLFTACSDSDPSSNSTDSVAAVESTAVAVVTDPATTVAPTTTSPPPSTVPVTTAASATTAVDCTADGDTLAKTSGDPLAISPVAYGTDIAASAALCSEVITVRFKGDMTSEADFPGWSVEYAGEPIIADSGASFTVQPGAVLLIRVGAMMPNAGGQGYAGAAQFVPTGVSHVLELLNTSNADGSATWAIALDAEYPFVVTVPDGPPRIVIELQTGS